MTVSIQGIEGIPEIQPGDDLGRIIAEACRSQGVTLQDDDVLVVTQKAVSKSEGRFVNLDDVEPSALAVEMATPWDKDPRHVEVVLRETKRIVKMDRGVIIVETRHGLVCANAGVDASNVPGGQLMLLPEDPDASARRIRDSLRRETGADVAVIISDTFGRPWRAGYTEVAIGVAGMLPIIDYVGQIDTHGRELRATWICVADELASSAELVTGKVNRVPAALIRGYAVPRGEGSAKEIVRAAELDLFR
ncbi:MAG TPA: coenzyme F420-0:L-glutamate ligase [Dehalococcoidia bacterium]|jgi:coenzyme F420-0:L-glutamate ligase/coenzyme F420-1:gamma-L-glutamate ligase